MGRQIGLQARRRATCRRARTIRPPPPPGVPFYQRSRSLPDLAISSLLQEKVYRYAAFFVGHYIHSLCRENGTISRRPRWAGWVLEHVTVNHSGTPLPYVLFHSGFNVSPNTVRVRAFHTEPKRRSSHKSPKLPRQIGSELVPPHFYVMLETIVVTFSSVFRFFQILVDLSVGVGRRCC